MRVAAALLSILIASAGCSAAVVDDGADDGQGVAPAHTQGSVTVARTVAAGPGMLAMRSDVAVRFARVTGEVDYRAVVGRKSALSADAAAGCTSRDAAAAPPSLPFGAGRIELLDVGDVELRAGGAQWPLAARAFPDVGEVVSGLVYTSRDDTVPLPAATDYAIATSGSLAVDGFELSAAAPGAPASVWVRQPESALDEQPLSAGELVLAAGAAVVLRWAPGEPAAGDRIYLDLEPLDDETAAVRCVFEDRGVGVVPELFVSTLGGAVELSFHRHRLVHAATPAIGDTVVDFDFAVAARASFGE